MACSEAIMWTIAAVPAGGIAALGLLFLVDTMRHGRKNDR